MAKNKISKTAKNSILVTAGLSAITAPAVLFGISAAETNATDSNENQTKSSKTIDLTQPDFKGYEDAKIVSYADYHGKESGEFLSSYDAHSMVHFNWEENYRDPKTNQVIVPDSDENKEKIFESKMEQETQTWSLTYNQNPSEFYVKKNTKWYRGQQENKYPYGVQTYGFAISNDLEIVPGSISIKLDYKDFSLGGKDFDFNKKDTDQNAYFSYGGYKGAYLEITDKNGKFDSSLKQELPDSGDGSEYKILQNPFRTDFTQGSFSNGKWLHKKDSSTNEEDMKDLYYAKKEWSDKEIKLDDNNPKNPASINAIEYITNNAKYGKEKSLPSMEIYRMLSMNYNTDQISQQNLYKQADRRFFGFGATTWLSNANWDNLQATPILANTGSVFAIHFDTGSAIKNAYGINPTVTIKFQTRKVAKNIYKHKDEKEEIDFTKEIETKTVNNFTQTEDLGDYNSFVSGLYFTDLEKNKFYWDNTNISTSPSELGTRKEQLVGVTIATAKRNNNRQIFVNLNESSEQELPSVKYELKQGNKTLANLGNKNNDSITAFTREKQQHANDVTFNVPLVATELNGLDNWNIKPIYASEQKENEFKYDLKINQDKNNTIEFDPEKLSLDIDVKYQLSEAYKNKQKILNFLNEGSLGEKLDPSAVLFENTPLSQDQKDSLIGAIENDFNRDHFTQRNPQIKAAWENQIYLISQLNSRTNQYLTDSEKVLESVRYTKAKEELRKNYDDAIAELKKYENKVITYEVNNTIQANGMGEWGQATQNYITTRAALNGLNELGTEQIKNSQLLSEAQKEKWLKEFKPQDAMTDESLKAFLNKVIADSKAAANDLISKNPRTTSQDVKDAINKLQEFNNSQAVDDLTKQFDANLALTVDKLSVLNNIDAKMGDLPQAVVKQYANELATETSVEKVAQGNGQIETLETNTKTAKELQNKYNSLKQERNSFKSVDETLRNRLSTEDTNINDVLQPKESIPTLSDAISTLATNNAAMESDLNTITENNGKKDELIKKVNDSKILTQAQKDTFKDKINTARTQEDLNNIDPKITSTENAMKGINQVLNRPYYRYASPEKIAESSKLLESILNTKGDQSIDEKSLQTVYKSVSAAENDGQEFVRQKSRDTENIEQKIKGVKGFKSAIFSDYVMGKMSKNKTLPNREALENFVKDLETNANTYVNTKDKIESQIATVKNSIGYLNATNAEDFNKAADALTNAITELKAITNVQKGSSQEYLNKLANVSDLVTKFNAAKDALDGETEFNKVKDALINKINSSTSLSTSQKETLVKHINDNIKTIADLNSYETDTVDALETQMSDLKTKFADAQSTKNSVQYSLADQEAKTNFDTAYTAAQNASEQSYAVIEPATVQTLVSNLTTTSAALNGEANYDKRVEKLNSDVDASNLNNNQKTAFKATYDKNPKVYDLVALQTAETDLPLLTAAMDALQKETAQIQKNNSQWVYKYVLAPQAERDTFDAALKVASELLDEAKGGAVINPQDITNAQAALTNAYTALTGDTVLQGKQKTANDKIDGLSNLSNNQKRDLKTQVDGVINLGEGWENKINKIVQNAESLNDVMGKLAEVANKIGEEEASTRYGLADPDKQEAFNAAKNKYNELSNVQGGIKSLDFSQNGPIVSITNELNSSINGLNGIDNWSELREQISKLPYLSEEEIKKFQKEIPTRNLNAAKQVVIRAKAQSVANHKLAAIKEVDEKLTNLTQTQKDYFKAQINAAADNAAIDTISAQASKRNELNPQLDALISQTNVNAEKETTNYIDATANLKQAYDTAVSDANTQVNAETDKSILTNDQVQRLIDAVTTAKGALNGDANLSTAKQTAISDLEKDYKDKLTKGQIEELKKQINAQTSTQGINTIKSQAQTLANNMQALKDAIENAEKQKATVNYSQASQSPKGTFDTALTNANNALKAEYNQITPETIQTLTNTLTGAQSALDGNSNFNDKVSKLQEKLDKSKATQAQKDTLTPEINAIGLDQAKYNEVETKVNKVVNNMDALAKAVEDHSVVNPKICTFIQ
ncbi:hypothetical protein [Mycoplasma seminis]|uniref:Extracellular matrix-binding protein ebh GA module domain-containing protein n=1 Tax=Mycoplasma seminis TaxID=512749 RepID=A0ABY9HAR7_9MOLU|nr:hypothetical protein [Mycoplasma seminis]WLP85703.1 hypothetical protein Q8852_00915 [Mycoplasma seminis]